LSKQRASTNSISTIPKDFKGKHLDTSTYQIKNPKTPHDLGYKTQVSKKHPSLELHAPTHLYAKLKKVGVRIQQIITSEATQKLHTPKPIPP